MSLKWKYYLFIILLHAITLTCLLYQFKDRKWTFFIIEILLFGFLIYGFSLYKQLTEGTTIMKTGATAIKDEDFTVKYRDVGNLETDEIIAIYNTMIDKLRKEKVNATELGLFLQKMILHSPLGIIVFDFDKQIEQINGQAKAILGDLVWAVNGHYQLKLETNNLIKTTNELGTIIEIKPGTKVKCHNIRIFHQGFYKEVVFITELTNEILQIQKDAYGKVIRMMAHEMNNSSGAINSIITSVIEGGFDPKNDEETKNLYIHSLSVALERNKSLVAFMENFAQILRLPKPNMVETSVVELIKRCIYLVQEDCHTKNIAIKTQFASNPQSILLDPILIEQVVINIIKNGIESIGQNGTVTITVDEQANLTITDDGEGISDENSEKIFTPFFSTKSNGQGIGLMLINEILYNHGANFNLKTHDDGLTNFTIHWS
ncbi:MAG TPA: ATP-binding protein [Saprospiraceae bacterium]|nr:ATP-binding protein [Saprospiraceae bacterium]